MLKVYHLNINSLSVKMHDIEAEIQEYDIVCFSESKLDNSISSESISLQGFQAPIRCDRTRHGGGVCVYVANDIAAKRRHDLEVNHIENVTVE